MTPTEKLEAAKAKLSLTRTRHAAMMELLRGVNAAKKEKDLENIKKEIAAGETPLEDVLTKLKNLDIKHNAPTKGLVQALLEKKKNDLENIQKEIEASEDPLPARLVADAVEEIVLIHLLCGTPGFDPNDLSTAPDG